MSGGNINMLLNFWAVSLLPHGEGPPFRNHIELYDTIDATTLGDTPWQSFKLHYTGQCPDGPVPSWMKADYDIWYRDPRMLIHNLISNPDFEGEFHYTPFHEYVDGKHRFQDFMSGDWAWKQAVSSSFLYRIILSKMYYRTILVKILLRMVQSLFPSSLEVTKQRSRSQQGKMNTGRYTFQLVISITLRDVRIEMGWYFSGSTLSQKVIFLENLF